MRYCGFFETIGLMVIAFARPRRRPSWFRRGLALSIVGAGVLGLTCDSAWAVPDGRPRPVSYDLSARWTPANRTLEATETILFRNDGTGTLPLVWVRLWPNDSIPGEADGCRYPNLTIQSVQGASAAGYAVACSALALTLAAPLAPGQSGEIALRFEVRAPTDNALFGRSAGIDLFGRAVPVLAVRDDAGWHLAPDTATGDPAYALSAAWRATLRVPASLTVASTGAKLSDSIDARSDERVVVAFTPHARDFGFAIGRLTTLTATVDGTEIKIFYPSTTNRSAAARALNDAGEVFATYSDWYGAYGSPELDLVLTNLGLDSQELPEIIFTNPGIDYLAHEIAHMWFYGVVGDDQYREPWLDESFASWNEEQFAPGTYPCVTQHPLGSRRGDLTLGLAHYEQRPDQYSDVVYRGGSCALTALAQELGRTRFIALLRAEVSRYRDGIIHTADFMALLTRTDAAVAGHWADLIGLPPDTGQWTDRQRSPGSDPRSRGD